MAGRGGYQMAKMSVAQRATRDALVRQILDAAKALYEQRLVRMSDIMVSQDEAGPHGANSNSIREMDFYEKHPDNDYRLQVTLVIQGVDR